MFCLEYPNPVPPDDQSLSPSCPSVLMLSSFVVVVPQVVSLVFARNVGAAKVVDALTSISGVEKPVLDQFSKAMLGAIGGSIDTNEVISLGWSPKDGSLWAEVRGKNVGSWKSAQLGKGIFDLYLGAKVSDDLVGQFHVVDVFFFFYPWPCSFIMNIVMGLLVGW